MGELKVIDNNRNEADETAVQYIVVKVGNEQYGIDIQYIDNIVKSQRITRVPKTQKYYNGVSENGKEAVRQSQSQKNCI